MEGLCYLLRLSRNGLDGLDLSVLVTLFKRNSLKEDAIRKKVEDGSGVPLLR